MPDREKVINGLRYCSDPHTTVCYECPYHAEFMGCSILARDALELLKEQEAEAEPGPGHWVVLENCSNAGVYCSECNTKIFDHYPMKKKYSYFCPHCGTRMEGQVVKWNG